MLEYDEDELDEYGYCILPNGLSEGGFFGGMDGSVKQTNVTGSNRRAVEYDMSDYLSDDIIR